MSRAQGVGLGIAGVAVVAGAIALMNQKSAAPLTANGFPAPQSVTCNTNAGERINVCVAWVGDTIKVLPDTNDYISNDWRILQPAGYVSPIIFTTPGAGEGVIRRHNHSTLVMVVPRGQELPGPEAQKSRSFIVLDSLRAQDLMLQTGRYTKEAVKELADSVRSAGSKYKMNHQ